MDDFGKLGQCADVEALEEQVTLQAHAMGFEYWVYSAKVLNGSRYDSDWSIHNLPELLWRAYVHCSEPVQDPISTRSKAEMTPRVWMLDATVQQAGTPEDPEDKIYNLLRVAQGLGVIGGLCIPVHDVAGAVGTLTLSSCQPVTHEALVGQLSRAMLFSKYLHVACGRCVSGAQVSKAPALSPRELECLSWAAMGKTSWEISQVLTISEHTANFHLRNATSKLGAFSRQAAIARSIQLGLLRAVA